MASEHQPERKTVTTAIRDWASAVQRDNQNWRTAKSMMKNHLSPDLIVAHLRIMVDDRRSL